MPVPRESSFMPTIKCSLCDRQVEISRMGEHVCSGFAAGEVSPPESDDDFTHEPPSKYGRRPPPPSKVEIPSGNQTYLNQGQLTPASYTSVSPITPADQQPPMEMSRRAEGYGGLGTVERRREPAPESPTRGNFFDRADMSPRINEPPSRPSAASSTQRNAQRDEQYGRRDNRDDRYGRAGNSNGSNAAPPRQQRTNGYGGLGHVARPTVDTAYAPLTPLSRADTFPRPSAPVDVPPRSPSAPGYRPGQTPKEPGRYEHERKKSLGVPAIRAPPRTELVKTPRDKKSSVNLAAEFGIGNPYHDASSPSVDSGYASLSHPPPPSTQGSTRSGSSTRSHTRQKPSDTSQLDALMATMQAGVGGRATPGLQLQPPKTFAQPYTPVSSISPMSEYPEEKLYEPPPPARRRDEAPRRGYGKPEPKPRYQDLPELGPGYYGSRHDDKARQTDPSRDRGRGESPERFADRDVGHGHAHPRAVCKSCRMPIKGKSISSADGRLTGKYHKACFVCTTCSRPFTSAEFYVLNDEPYCEHHYHKLNGSLCGACERGIEGQYVEDEARVKYHVGCFCCLDCDRSLSDGYFEFDGKTFCERCALRRERRAKKALQPEPELEPEPEVYNPPRIGSRPAAPGGLPGNPRQRGVGLPSKPKQRQAPGGMPRANKRMTRLGML